MNLEQLLEFLRGRGRQGNPYEGLRLQQEGAAREDANRAIQQRNQQMNMDRMNQMNRMRPQMQPQMPDMPQMQEQMQNRMRMMSDDDLSGLLKQMQQQTAPSVNPEGIAGSLLGRPQMSDMQRRMMDQRMMAPRIGASFGVQR